MSDQDAAPSPQTPLLPTEMSLPPQTTAATPSEDGSSREAEAFKTAELKVNELQEALWRPQREEYLIMVSLAILSLMVAIDATIIVTALPAVTKSIHGTTTDAFWVGTSYLLTCAVFQPFIAALSDIFGRQQLLIPSVTFFTVGAIVAGVAHNFRTLLVGRCIQGIGGGGIVAMSMVIFTDIVPLRYRPKWYGIIQGAWALGTVLGPFLGGLFAQHSTWRWIFYINLPFCGIGLVVVPLVVRLETKVSSFKEKCLRVDWFGGFLFIASVTSFLIAVSWGGVQEPWSSWRTLVPLIVGVAGVAAVICWEYWGAKQPFMRRSLFYCWSAVAAYSAAVSQGLLLFSQMYYTALYLSSVLLKSPTATGTALFPVMFALVPASIVVGVIVTHLGHFRWAVIAGWALIVLGSLLQLLLWHVGTHTHTWAPTMIIIGLGHGLTLNALNFTTQAIARTRDAAYAAATYAFCRQFGMAIGVAVGGSTFQNAIKHALTSHHLPAAIAADAEGYVSTLKALPKGSELRDQVLHAYADGFHGVCAVLLGIAVLGLALSLCIKHFSLDKELETEHVLKSNRNSRMTIMSATVKKEPTQVMEV